LGRKKDVLEKRVDGKKRNLEEDTFKTVRREFPHADGKKGMFAMEGIQGKGKGNSEATISQFWFRFNRAKS